MFWLNVAMSIDLPTSEPRLVRFVPRRVSSSWYCAFVTSRGLLPHPATVMDTAKRRSSRTRTRLMAVARLPTPGCAAGGAEITPVEPDLASTSEGSERLAGHTALGNRACARAFARARTARHDAPLDEPRHLTPRARAAGLFRPSARGRTCGDG